ncbi:MAG: methyltransferase domain-containing protein [Longimicrobiales bacterium]
MRQTLLQYLACPACGGDLALCANDRDGEHVMSGSLSCTQCAAGYAIRNGIPRFNTGVEDIEVQTAAAFGYEWNRYNELADRYRQQFLDWLRPVDASFFAGKAVLEGGCGKGRHTALAASFGARAVVSLDLGNAVEAAFANTRHLPNAHIVQADLKKPPVKRAFDYAFSIGVLHHITDPEAGFQALVSKLVPCGAISAWVYGREGNGWIVHFVSPLRETITSRMPHGLLDALSGLLSVPLFLATRYVYAPLKGRLFGMTLPYGPYLSYIGPFPFREQRSIVLDHLVTPIAFYLRRDEFAGWFERARLQGVRIEHHNANSWRGFAQVPARNPAPERAAVPAATS